MILHASEVYDIEIRTVWFFKIWVRTVCSCGSTWRLGRARWRHLSRKRPGFFAKTKSTRFWRNPSCLEVTSIKTWCLCVLTCLWSGTCATLNCVVACYNAFILCRLGKVKPLETQIVWAPSIPNKAKCIHLPTPAFLGGTRMGTAKSAVPFTQVAAPPRIREEEMTAEEGWTTWCPDIHG